MVDDFPADTTTTGSLVAVMTTSGVIEVAGDADWFGANLGAGFTYTFVAYGFGCIPDSIWYKRNWGTTWRAVFDALLYGLFTGGVFGWLWPKM